MTSPPRPPSPPSGPPNSINFSRRNDRQPAPPSPERIVTLAESRNLMANPSLESKLWRADWGTRDHDRTEKADQLFKILPSFQWPGIKVGLRHGDPEEPFAIDIRAHLERNRAPIPFASAARNLGQAWSRGIVLLAVQLESFSCDR